MVQWATLHGHGNGAAWEKIYSLLKQNSLCTELGTMKAQVDKQWNVKGGRKVWKQEAMYHMLNILADLPTPLVRVTATCATMLTPS